MGGRVSLSISLEKVKAAALLLVLVCVLSSGLLFTAAIAGTETGEFCPTCPDWTNLEGWLAQRDAYERAQMQQQNGQQESGQAAMLPAVVPEKAPESYARPDLITMPQSLDEEGIILDARSKEDYLAGHISGARNIYWKDQQKRDDLDPSLLEKALGEAGIDESQRIIIYGSSKDEGGPFLFWALSYLGHDNLSLLDGGVEAAQEAGAFLSSNAPAVQSSNYSASIRPWMLVEPASLEGMLGQSSLRILDARDFSEYGQSRLGNGSICLSHDKIYDERSRIKPPGTLKSLFERRTNPDDTVIVYGTPQAYYLFYSLRLMGSNATLIQGDWWKQTEWAVSNIS